MSEYWKSTPKYWCKHCKTYVRDTKLEKQNHEATPKHQGNIKRFLRDLHRGHERDEREKQRAKDEVDRLNGVKPGSSISAVAGSEGAPWRRKLAIPPPSSSTAKQATPEERKRQVMQLAEMGVAIPEDFRREMAMAGDWQTMSERPIYEAVKKEEDDQDEKSTGMSIGVRKRKYEGQDEEDEAGETVVRRGWGSTIRTLPGAGNEEDDLDTLLNATRVPRKKDDFSNATATRIADTRVLFTEPGPSVNSNAAGSPGVPPIKKEESIEGTGGLVAPQDEGTSNQAVKQEENTPGGGIVFKKRRPKSTRQH